MPNIVNIAVSQQVAPAPATLQQSAALVSQGGTILAPNTRQVLTQPSDLTPILTGAKTLSNLAWASGTVTVTTTAAHGLDVGDVLLITIAGVTPAGYNGTYSCTITAANTFTYKLAASPGTATVFGAYTLEDVAELLAQVTTFFTQGRYRSVTVLELGPDTPDEGVAQLNSFITANPNAFYAYLVPRTWDGLASFLAFLPQFNGLDKMTYFFVTTTLTNYVLYTSLMKCVVPVIEAPAYGVWQQNPLSAISWTTGKVTATTTMPHGVLPGQWFQIQGCVPTGYNGWWQAASDTTGSTLTFNLATNPGVDTVLGTLVASYAASAGIPSTEFTAAAFLWKAISYNPKSTNRVAPYNFSFLYGVTPFPTFGNSGLLTTLKLAATNVVLTGAQGGISNTMVAWGTTRDGRKWNYWYTVDWMIITSQLQLTNAIINGSNNPVNPLYYNQAGINRLENVQVGVVNDGVAFGLVLFTAIEVALDGPDLDVQLDQGTYNGYSVVNAVPFITYSQENPGDYAAGIYDGLSVTFTPVNGFDEVTLNIVVSDFVASA